MKNKIRFNNVALGVLLIACAVVIILDSLGVSLGFFNGIPATTLILGSLVLVWFLTNLIRLKIPGLFIPLAILFVLFEKYIASALSLESKNIIDNWIVFVVAILLNCGFSMLLPKSSMNIRFGKSIYINGKNSTHTSNSESNHTASSKGRKNSMSSSIVYIDCSTFVSETVTNEMGSCQIYFTNVDQYAGNGVLTVKNRLGSMCINIPYDWSVNNQISNSMSSVSDIDDGTSGGLSITLNGSNELGSLSINKE